MADVARTPAETHRAVSATAATGQPGQRSPLGLGPLETAIMQALWKADDWVMVQDIRDRMDYPPVAYTHRGDRRRYLVPQRAGPPRPWRRRRAPRLVRLVVSRGQASHRTHRPTGRHALGPQLRPTAALAHALATTKAFQAGDTALLGRITGAQP